MIPECVFLSRTPAMIGGLFAVDRMYFQQLGGLDPGMEIWGGENIELSFRVCVVNRLINITLYIITNVINLYTQ